MSRGKPHLPAFRNIYQRADCGSSPDSVIAMQNPTELRGEIGEAKINLALQPGALSRNSDPAVEVTDTAKATVIMLDRFESGANLPGGGLKKSIDRGQRNDVGQSESFESRMVAARIAAQRHAKGLDLGVGRVEVGRAEDEDDLDDEDEDLEEEEEEEEEEAAEEEEEEEEEEQAAEEEEPSDSDEEEEEEDEEEDDEDEEDEEERR